MDRKSRTLGCKDANDVILSSSSHLLDSTNEALDAIRKRDFERLVPLMSLASIPQIRTELHRIAKQCESFEPNLSQALGIVGGRQERIILRNALRRSSLASSSHLHESGLYIAFALLRLEHSLKAAHVVKNALRSSRENVRHAASIIISRYLLSNPPIPVARVLERALPDLLCASDSCFFAAFPILFQMHYRPALARCQTLLLADDVNTQTQMFLSLLNVPHNHGVPLLVRAFRSSKSLEPKLRVANQLAPLLSSKALKQLVEEGLNSSLPSQRLMAAGLLALLELPVARKLAKRIDSDANIDKVLSHYRKTGT